jgi:hypothetical protein
VPSTRITSDQLLFRSAFTGDHLLDTYLEDAQINGRELSDILAGLTDANGDFDNALLSVLQFRINPSVANELQSSTDGIIWTTVGFLPTGPGTGDMLGANNLSDLTNPASARSNLGLGTLSELNQVDTAEITDGSVTIAKLAQDLANPYTLYGRDVNGNPINVTVGAGVNLVGTTLTGSGGANYDVVLSDGVDYTAGNGLPYGDTWANLGLIDPGGEENLAVFFDGVQQFPDPANYTFNATTITFTSGIPALVDNVRIRINA